MNAGATGLVPGGGFDGVSTTAPGGDDGVIGVCGVCKLPPRDVRRRFGKRLTRASG